MADKKITALTALTAVAETDVLAVVDVSATETKKATKAVLLAPITANGTNVGIGTTVPGALLQLEGGTESDAFRIGMIASDQYYKIGRVGATGILQFSGQQQTYSGYDFKIYPTGGAVGTSALKIATGDPG